MHNNDINAFTEKEEVCTLIARSNKISGIFCFQTNSESSLFIQSSKKSEMILVC